MIILIPSKNKIDIYISKKKRIIYNGYFTLIKSYKILIDDIVIHKKYQKVNINDKELIKILKKGTLIITEKNKELSSFLKEEGIKFQIKQVCENCLQRKIIRVLTEENMYTLLKKHYCHDCACIYLNYMIKSNAYTDYSRTRYEILLDKYQDLMKILDIMESKYNPHNPELTLVNTLPVTEEEYTKTGIEKLKIPLEFKQILKRKIEHLLPVQSLAIEKGLLDDENLLVISATASGKTLIGELAGITKALNNKKMIYLSPLVALANQKYHDFKRDYEELGLNITIKVGYNRVKTDEELYIPDQSIEDADIIVATYEGLDYILRSGKYNELNDLGVVIIDEIHMLDNEERGHRLNGLVNRLITLFNDVQLIGLSATINNAQEIAEAFGMKLVNYDKRPVTIEEHIVSLKQQEKMKFIVQLCKNEFNIVSSKNYHGQTIIFTDSRRNTQRISNYLQKNGIKSAYYHAGLTYNRKIEIEQEFSKQDISTIVTTSALANGVDFPASLVIFESLRMGFEWLTPNEFHQMLGRTGRPSYHDLGKVYLLPVINRKNETEYDIAHNLVNSTVENVSVLYDVDDVFEQVLSDISAIGHADLENLKKQYDKLDLPITFNETVNELKDKHLIEYDTKTNFARATSYGICVAKSFINVKVAEYIREHLQLDVLDVCLNIKQINNVYLSDKMINSFKNNDVNIGNRLFSDNIRSMFFNGDALKLVDNMFQSKIVNIVNDFMLCSCEFSPLCDCLEKNISWHIINRRLQGWSPNDISKEFKREYELDVYPGDIYSYLDETIRILDAIRRIAGVNGNSNTYDDCVCTIKKIEEG